MQWIACARLYPVKRVPKPCRLLWADILADTLTKICAHPAETAPWVLLFALPKLCLRTPPRGNRKKVRPSELAPHLSRLLCLARDGNWGTLFDEAQQALGKIAKPFAQVEETAERIKERVLALVETGQLSKAVKALDSQGMHACTEDVILKLREKHPLSPPLPPAEVIPTPLRFTIPLVRKAVGAFHAGSAPGASKLHPAHLQDAMSAPTADAGCRLSAPLTFVVNLLARRGRAMGCRAPVYPLKKKDNGVRPIAVGETIRRLVSRCFCRALQPKFESFFAAVGQMGVGVRCGAEAVVHAVRLATLQSPSHAILKVDFENAFNTVSRATILRIVHEYFPSLEAWFRFTYSSPAPLFCNHALLPFASVFRCPTRRSVGPCPLRYGPAPPLSTAL